MTQPRSLIAVLLAATALAAPVLAQETPGAASRPDREARSRAAFERIDTSRDGFIDRSESRVAREAIFDRLDSNKDGRLVRDELVSTRRASPGRDGGINAQPGTASPAGSATARNRPSRAERTLRRFDTDKDGAISRAEWLAADDARFDRCDMNKDGKLAFGECRLAQARR